VAPHLPEAHEALAEALRQPDGTVVVGIDEADRPLPVERPERVG
jgi:hypothetical protein